MYLSLLAVLLSVLDHSQGSEIEWNYDTNGPDAWPHEFKACKGALQSPINLDTSIAEYDMGLRDVNFFNYDKLLAWNISNNGHTIMGSQVNVTSFAQIPYINGSDFEKSRIFYLKQFHFHWGLNIWQGSEHHIDSQKYPAEMHMVHQANTSEMAVVSFLFKIIPSDNTKLNPLLNTIGNEVFKNSTLIWIESHHITRLKLNSIVPDSKETNQDGYFKYTGSLTTPPCTQGVTWLIFETKITISEKQMINFYKNTIKVNFREVQSLGSRKLFISKANTKYVSIWMRLRKAFDALAASFIDAFSIFVSKK